MDPVGNSLFSHDSRKYVYQDPNVWIVHSGQSPTKPFKLNPPEKTNKTKKDFDKNNKNESKND